MRSKVDPRQIKLLQDSMTRVEKHHPTLGLLYERLLEEGGLAVVPVPEEPDADRIIDRGTLFSPKGSKVVEGVRNSCHANAARLNLGKEGIDIVTGYAMSDDQVWRQHSWGLLKGKVIETTSPRKLYFGYILTPEEARYFCFVNLHLESLR